MRKRIILAAMVGLIIFLVTALFLPVSYRITVRSSSFFETCSSPLNTTASIQCEVFEPPKIIEKRESFVAAWWNKRQIDTTYPKKEVSTQWVGVMGK